MAKYKSKLKRNSKYNPHSERFKRHKAFSSVASIETCDGKVAYATINKARQAKKHIERHGNIMNIYKCPHCKRYHLTTE